MKKDYRDVLDTAARTQIPDDINLFPSITEQLKRGKNPTQLPMKLALAVILLLAVFIIILPSVPDAAMAIRRLIGYVPGVGLIETSSIRILAEPMIAKQDRLIVTISTLVADSSRTIVHIRIDGIPRPKGGWPFCDSAPQMRIPDGTGLELTGGGPGGIESEGVFPISIDTNLIFSPIPEGVDRVTIFLPCILPLGTGPENWEIPLTLIPAPADFATPAVEIGATYVASGPKFETTPTITPEFTPEFVPSFPPTPTPVPNGSGLYLEKVIELDNAYILIGNFTDAGDLPGFLVISTGSNWVYRPIITDANGQQIQFKERTEIQPEVNWGGVYFWAYEIPKPVNAPLTIKLEQVIITKINTAQFQFDTGPSSESDQVIKLGKHITLGDKNFVIESVTVLEKGYKFTLSSEIPGECCSFSFKIRLLDVPSEATINSSEGINLIDKSIFIETIGYDFAPPTGPVNVEIQLLENVPLPGPWTLTWSPTVNP
jgi:hypothetical protein